MAYELLNACKKLHEKNIVHRDIKAANIFFANDIAKLGDLNVSKVADNGYCETHTGTPYYTSPEIWNGPNTHQNVIFGPWAAWSMKCVLCLHLSRQQTSLLCSEKSSSGSMNRYQKTIPKN